MALVKVCRCGRSKWSRCDHHWYADVRLEGRRRRIDLGSSERREARARHAQIEADRASGKVARAAAGRDLGALTRRAIDTTSYRPRSTDTRNAQRSIIVAYFGDAPVEAVTERDVIDFRRTLESTPRPTTRQPPSASYVRGTMSLLRAALAIAQEEGMIERAPWPLFRSRRREDDTTDHLGVADIARVIEWMRSHRPRRGPQPRAPYGDMAEFDLLTGLRLGELLGLQGSADLDLEAGTMKVQRTLHKGGRVGPPKNHTSRRTIMLTPRAVELARTHYRPGRLWDADHDSARLALDRALVALGLKVPRRGWHIFRHAHTAMLDEAGVGIRTAGARMGHGAHFAQTAAYGWSAEALPVDALDRVWAGHATPPSGA